MRMISCLTLVIAEYKKEFRVISGYQIKIESASIVSCLDGLSKTIRTGGILDPVYCAYF